MKYKQRHPQKHGQKGQKPSKKPQEKNLPKPKIKVHLFGLHAVREAWLNPKRHVHALYLTESAFKQFEPVLKEGRGLKRPQPEIVDKDLLDKALPPGTVHQGTGLNCQPLAEVSIRDLIILAGEKPKSLFVILDQVTDPHNVGAILRSACVFGADGVILQSRHAPELEGILAKTACGAAEYVPVAYETNLSRTIEVLKEAGYFVYGLDERGVNLKGLSGLPERVVLVLGAEGPGMRPLVKQHCDALVRLPTGGPISSLNVSNAAAVALYAFRA